MHRIAAAALGALDARSKGPWPERNERARTRGCARPPARARGPAPTRPVSLSQPGGSKKICQTSHLGAPERVIYAPAQLVHTQQLVL